MVKYKTIKTKKVLSERKLKGLGRENWHLGGVAQQKVSEQEADEDIPAAITTVRRRYFYYHFWREVETHECS